MKMRRLQNLLGGTGTKAKGEMLMVMERKRRNRTDWFAVIESYHPRSYWEAVAGTCLTPFAS